MENQNLNYDSLIANIKISEKLSKIDLLSKFLSGSFIYYYQESNKKNMGQTLNFKQEDLDVFKEKFKEFSLIMLETIDLFQKDINEQK
jgi:hypothetical protein